MVHEPLRRTPSEVAAFDRNRVIDMLEQIERVEPDATGALVFGAPERPSGIVLLEGGRICWAMVGGMGRRLTDLLRRHCDPPPSPEDIERIYQTCRREDRPLGEALVAAGLATPASLESALRRHTSEAIGVLSQISSTGADWKPHRSRRYDARYTFSTADVLVVLGSAGRSGRAALAQRDLDETLELGGIGVAFMRATPYPSPIAAVGATGLRARQIADLGRWVMDGVDLRLAVSEHAELTAFCTSSGHAAMTWAKDGVMSVALCEDMSTLNCAFVKRRRLAER